MLVSSFNVSYEIELALVSLMIGTKILIEKCLLLNSYVSQLQSMLNVCTMKRQKRISLYSSINEETKGYGFTLLALAMH